MVTTIGTEATLESLLTDLAQLDFDAVAAYQAAIDRLENPQFKAALSEFRDDHLRHTRELGECLRAMGKEAPTEGDMKQILAKGKVVIGGMLGDRAILEAMRTNEDDTVTAYDRAVRHKDCPRSVLDVLEGAQRDEHRHRAWMETALKALKS
jgi:uncharacterized protein (TIGR02284 family)